MQVPKKFVSESYHIEGIDRVTQNDIEIHNIIMYLKNIKVADIENFVFFICNKRLRDKVGMDVMVGSHIPPKGGPEIRHYLEDHIRHVNQLDMSPFQAHIEYETLHPFLDGNGRSGRLLWAWQMHKMGENPFALPFLHTFYYQSLEASRK